MSHGIIMIRLPLMRSLSCEQLAFSCHTQASDGGLPHEHPSNRLWNTEDSFCNRSEQELLTQPLSVSQRTCFVRLWHISAFRQLFVAIQ